MIEVFGNLWDFYEQGKNICITTNGFVKNNGCCVMGRGCAYEATAKFPGIEKILGDHIKQYGNIPVMMKDRIYSLPVKVHFKDAASKELIHSSLHHLHKKFPEQEFYVPRPGCGFGQLHWQRDVKDICSAFGDWLRIVTWKK